VALLLFITFLLFGGTESDVRQAVLSALVNRGADASKIEVEVLRVSGIGESAGPLRIELTGDAIPRSRAQVRVVRETAAGTESGWALLNVVHFDSVAVTTSAIVAGSSLQMSDLSFEWMDVTAFRGRPLRKADLDVLPADAVWARPVAENRPVRVEDVRLPFAAETGDTILMDYTRSGLQFRISCRARESGSVGDVIRLYSPETRATYRARLTGPGTAVWIETR
jgi:flagellar basal body P-ring formation protein FlgA